MAKQNGKKERLHLERESGNWTGILQIVKDIVMTTRVGKQSIN